MTFKTALCALFVFLLSIQSLAFATPISSIVVTNTSDSDEILAGENYRVREFQTSNIGNTPVAINNNVASFTNQFSWMSAQIVDPGAPNFALIYQRHISYELDFTIEDPSNIGYSLDIDTALRGYLTAALNEEPLDPNAPETANAHIQVSWTSFLGKIDDGSGPVAKSGLNISGGLVSVTESNPEINFLIDKNKNFSAGNYFGTKTFSLIFSTRPSPNASTVLQNYTQGEAAIRYGLDPLHTSGGDLTKPDFNLAFYPGSDGETAGNHGHFVNVTATFNGQIGNPVPEPSTFLLLGFGLAGIALISNKRKIR